MGLWVRMLLLTALALATPNGWAPTCAAKDSGSLWFVFEGKPPEKDSPAPPDFTCPGLFLDGVVCGNSVGVGKVSFTSKNSIGQDQFELRYLPYGETTSIMGFLNKQGGGVGFPPIYTPATPSMDDPPPNAAELLRQYLIKRQQASQATQGIKLHTWTCPEAKFDVPIEEMEPHGMSHQAHTARAPI
jgi:hypothetical protein